jgi:hypothetical protein
MVEPNWVELQFALADLHTGVDRDSTEALGAFIEWCPTHRFELEYRARREAAEHLN